MGSSRHHKVCFPIAGVPAIVRIIDTLKAAGLKRFLLVVGQRAVDVMETVTRVHADVSFAYQPEALGTGHAAECAARVLRDRRAGGDVLITMGDKVIEGQVVRDLIERHRAEAADLTLAALHKEPDSTAGRILLDSESRPLAVVELADIRRSSETGVPITVAGQEISGAEVESRSRLLNTSLYLFRAETLHASLSDLAADNAQQELYLTDTVEQVAETGGTTSVLEVADHQDLMGFNTPEELLRIEEALGRRKLLRDGSAEADLRIDPDRLKPAGEWLEILDRKPASLRRSLIQVYGFDGALLEPRIRACRRLLERFVESHGASRSVVLARAPGRLNLMGRHVDHRGGYVNTMAINREILLAASPREDDTVSLRHLSSDEFPERTFRIRDLLPDTDWLAWMDFISSYTVNQFLSVSRGDWSNYARAAVLRLQHAYPRRRLRGMDCVVWGDIPLGAGLSSSSALVVAMAEASVALNQLALSTRQFVDLCGEGEWFVGSRGGIADQAAIRGGERDKVSKIGFFPFRIEETIALPPELSVIIANSQAAVSKSHKARHTFNHRVACYDLAEILLRKNAPVLASMKHLRDLEPRKLGLSRAEIYRLLKQLPQETDRGRLLKQLPDQARRLQEVFSTHDDVGEYPLRGVALFGITECRRSDRFSRLLNDREFSGIGKMMRISHDGDRIVRHRLGRSRPHAPACDDRQMDRLIRDSFSPDPARRENAELWMQPGSYSCSTSKIDRIVDLADAQPGVVGAQLSGAGLGGCAMILVRTEAVEQTLAHLTHTFYEAQGLEVEAYVCRPVAGSGLIECR